MGGLVRGRLLIWGDAMCLRARIRSFKPPELHFLSFYHNLEVDKDCLVTQLCLFCIVTSLKILASYTLLPLLMYSCKFQLRNSIFIIRYTITCALDDQSCRCAIKQHSFIHSIYIPPNKSISQNDLENLLLQLPQPYIICGDFNGHSELWGCSDTNDRGKILEDFITENNLCLFNSNQHTYLHPGSGSFTAIDLSLCHPSLYLIMSGKYVRILMEVIIFLLSCMKLKKQILTKFQNGILKKLTGKNLIFFAMKN